MVIKASASAEVRTLVEALDADDEVHREAAIARLGIIGARAVDRLTDAYANTSSRATRLAILRALEGIGDHRSAPLARQALGDGGDVAVAATGILRALLSSTNSTVAAAALDTLVATTLDRHHERRLRLAAFDALQELPDDVRTRVAAALRGDPGGGLNDVAGVITTAGSDAARAEALWKDALEGRLPDAPDELRAAVATRASTAPLNTLRTLVDVVRSQERDAGGDGARRGWTALRGSLHQALAFRGSRVALYDLRETLDGRGDAAADVVPDRAARPRRRVVSRAARRGLGRRRAGPDRGRTPLAPAAGVSPARDRPAREDHEAARGDEEDRGALAGGAGVGSGLQGGSRLKAQAKSFESLLEGLG